MRGFLSIDPLAEEFPDTSPYAFCSNNPLRFTDPTGMEPEDNIDPPSKRDKTSRLDGWNKTVGEFNNNFSNKVNSFIQGNPISQAADVALGFLNDTASLVGDCIPGLTQAMGIENQTGNSIIGAGNAIYDFPNASNEQQGASLGMAAILITEIAITEKLPLGENVGRSGRQAKLKSLVDDVQASSADRGWIKQEMNQIDRGKRSGIRNPPGKQLAHERGREAAKGFSYEYSNLQNTADHRAQHKYDNNGRANKVRK